MCETMIDENTIKKVTIELLKRTVTRLPNDIQEALEKAYANEEKDVPKMQLKAILDNIKLAGETIKPLCQDTGIHIFFVKLPKWVDAGIVEKSIKEAVEEGTKLIPLRPNAVHPITRKNPGTNTGINMPYINFKYTDKNYLEITSFPKGAGSENMSALGMLTPSQGIKGIKEFALNTLLKAGAKPCPPIIMGIGIGGSADISMKLAKQSLLRPINKRHEDPQIAELESELLDALNDSGIGPMGLGGKTTVLGVNIEYGYCHTASHPVGINIQCWCARRGTIRIYKNGRVEHLTHGGD